MIMVEGNRDTGWEVIYKDEFYNSIVERRLTISDKIMYIFKVLSSKVHVNIVIQHTPDQYTSSLMNDEYIIQDGRLTEHIPYERVLSEVAPFSVDTDFRLLSSYSSYFKKFPPEMFAKKEYSKPSESLEGRLITSADALEQTIQKAIKTCGEEITNNLLYKS